MTRWLVIVCCAACGHAATPAPVVAKQPSACERIADHVVSLMSAAQKAKPEALDPFRNVISKRCTEDAWSPAVHECLGAITSVPEGNRCEQMMTEAQATAFEHDLQVAFEALKADVAASPPAAPAAAASPMEAKDAEQVAPPAPEQDKARKAKKAKAPSPGASSDPCEGGE